MFERKTEDIDSLLPDEPASKNYFLAKGFSDLKNTIKDSFSMNKTTASANIQKAKSSDAGKIKKIFGYVLRGCAAAAVMVFGTIITLFVSIIHSVIVCIIMLGVYAVYGVARLLDNIYVKTSRIAVICDKCKARSELPGYKCPKCGQIHYRLRPNVYGMFTHKCLCGQKLPAQAFNTTKSKDSDETYQRKALESICANPNCSCHVHSKESRPLCIPIAGSPSVGKTAYLTAATHELIENKLPASGCTIEHYTPEKETKYLEAAKDFSNGETSKTIESNNHDDPSSFSLSFFVDNSSLKPRRLVHMFDIAGETFVRNEEHERQLHYSYANGVILIIDPMAIEDVAEQYEDQLNEVDTNAIGREDPDTTLASLVTKMQNASVLSTGQKIEVPLAIVINKIDEPGVCDYFTDEKVQTYKSAQQTCTDVQAKDALCRAFLRENSMGNFVNTAEVNFKTIHYFACSSIGHSRGDGEYAPLDVLSPIIWIASLTDEPLTKLIIGTNTKD